MEFRGTGPTSNGGPRNGDAPDAAGDSQGAAQVIALGKAAARAANTRKTYSTGWNSWARWAAEHGRPELPVTVEGLENWLATLWSQGKKPTTLSVYRAAVAYELDKQPGPNPAREFQVGQLIAGLKRKGADHGITPQQAAPLRWQEIQRIVRVAYEPRCNQPGGRIETPEQAAHRANVDIAMICVAHDAALRCSELLALIWADIDLATDDGNGVVLVRRSKTDQNGQGATASISGFTSRALTRMRPTDAKPEDLVFDISPSTVTRRFKKAAESASIDPANITSHSPRVGMAQDLVAHGIDLPGLMMAGRWNTPSAAANYAKRLAAHHTSVSRYLKTQDQTNLGGAAQHPGPTSALWA